MGEFTRYLTVMDYQALDDRFRPQGVHEEIRRDLGGIWVALRAPAATHKGREIHPGLLPKSTVLASRLTTRSDADADDNRVILACLQEFVIRNGSLWQSSLDEFEDLSSILDFMRRGLRVESTLLRWLALHVAIPRGA